MQKIKTTLQNLPKHTQWLLLGVAFLVVIVLLFLLLGNREPATGNQQPATSNQEPVVLTITPDKINWQNSAGGDTKNATVEIRANIPTIVSGADFTTAVPKLTRTGTCAETAQQITDKIPCIIRIEWTADDVDFDAKTELAFRYRAANLPEKMVDVATLPIAVSSVAKPKPVQEQATRNQEPVDKDLITPPRGGVGAPSASVGGNEQPLLPAPLPEPAPVFLPDPVFVEPIKPAIELPAPIPVAPKTEAEIVLEKCYQFAFAGFDMNGIQTGWIKPDRGRYFYHPYDDVDCSNATGEYNPDTGMITDLKNPSRTIGSDSENIGLASGGMAVPQLSNPVPTATVRRAVTPPTPVAAPGGSFRFIAKASTDSRLPSSVAGEEATVSSFPSDRTFVLRQFKPIPATIVNEVRADIKTGPNMLPVQATVDRHVYSDNGRTIIVPAGTLMLGFVTGEMPGPYKTIGRMNIRWYRFVRPDGSEFNFPSAGPFAADSQGRMGVPGRGSTDYIEEFFMPMLTALVPAAINMIAPISDRFVNQIDLDNNTVTQTGVARSSELAKNEIITAWNRVAQKLAIDMMDNMTPPFSIAAGTRITVFSPTDLIINYCDPDDENCGLNDKIEYAKYMDAMSARAQILRNPSQNEYASWVPDPNTVRPEDIGQVRGGFDAQGNLIANDARAQAFAQGMQQYQSQTAAQYNQYYQQQANASTTTNQNNLGLQYNASGQIIDPFASAPKPVATTPAEPVGLLCEDSTPPDINGCCTGEIFTDMAEQGWNCCPAGGGDCFPPLR